MKGGGNGTGSVGEDAVSVDMCTGSEGTGEVGGCSVCGGYMHPYILTDKLSLFQHLLSETPQLNTPLPTLFRSITNL